MYPWYSRNTDYAVPPPHVKKYCIDCGTPWRVPGGRIEATKGTKFGDDEYLYWICYACYDKRKEKEREIKEKKEFFLRERARLHKIERREKIAKERKRECARCDKSFTPIRKLDPVIKVYCPECVKNLMK